MLIPIPVLAPLATLFTLVTPTLAVPTPTPQVVSSESTPQPAEPTILRVSGGTHYLPPPTGSTPHPSPGTGLHADGQDLPNWSWHLTYSPRDEGTYCLYVATAETPGGAEMLAYLSDSEEPGTSITVAGKWDDRTGAACISGMSRKCIDIYAQWGEEENYSAEGVHCTAVDLEGVAAELRRSREYSRH